MLKKLIFLPTIFQKSKEKLSKKDGEVITHTVLTILIYFFATIVVLNVLIYTFHFFSLHYTARAVTRVIEREGAFNSVAVNQLNELNEDFGTQADLEVNDVTYIRGTKNIQYMDPFQVTIRDEHSITIMTPSFSKKLTWDFPMKATVSGRSEVYWKE